MEPFQLRASSIAELLDCPKRWEQKYIYGQFLPSSPPAAIGTAVHASTAVYDQSKIDGSGLTVDDAAGAAIDSLYNPTEEVDWQDVDKSDAEQTVLAVHNVYCNEVSPTQDYLIVEHTLEPLQIDMGDGLVLEMTGTLDRVRVDALGAKGVADVKTGKTAVNAKGEVQVSKHLPQLGAYTLLAEQEFGTLAAPAAVIGLATLKTPRAGVQEVPGAKEALIGKEDQPGILHFVSTYFKTGLFPPNPGSWLCSEKFCPYYRRCQFHG